MRNISIYPLLVALILLAIGCSNSNQAPVTQDLPVDNNITTQFENTDGHALAGFWSLIFDIDDKSFDIQEARQSQSHLSIGSMLPKPTILINSWDPVEEVLDIDFTIENPFDLTGYDLRVIIYSDDIGHSLVNNDGYTGLFDIPGGDDINPFKAYSKDDQFRAFHGLSSQTENLLIHMPGFNYQVYFAVDVSYPYNCTEPYEITDFVQSEKIYNLSDSSSWIQVTVRDWNNQVSYVTITAPEITGEPETYLNYQGNFVWGKEITNTESAPEGIYDVLIKGTCDLPTEISLYDYGTIEVKEASDVVDWTILIYMHESNLGAYAIQNLNTLERVGSLEYETDIVVLWDKEDDPDDCILHIEKDPDGFNPNIISPEIDDGGEVIPPGGLAMGNQSTLEKFLRWGIENYPAENYGLILWDHGNGPFSFLPEVVKSCCNGLQIWEIRNACSIVLDENPEIIRFDWIGFDCCLMAWIETAYCLRNVTEITVASEMVEPAPGWNYYPWVQLMTENSDTITAEEMTYEIVDQYLQGSTGGYEKTLSAVRSDDIVNEVIPALDNFATALIAALDDGKRGAIGDCRTQCGKWGAFCDEGPVKDLGYFAELCDNSSELPQDVKDTAWILIQELDDSMVLHGHTGDGASACPYQETGLQIWWPAAYWHNDNESRRNDYASLEFDDTLWDDFLAEYD